MGMCYDLVAGESGIWVLRRMDCVVLKVAWVANGYARFGLLRYQERIYVLLKVQL